MTQRNPYQSPTVETSGPPEGRRPVFRWRVLTATLMAVFGGMLLLSGLIALVSLPVMVFLNPHGLTARVILGGMATAAVGLTVGPLFCITARWWWQRRWRRAIVGTVACGLLYGATALVFSLLGIE